MSESITDAELDAWLDWTGASAEWFTEAAWCRVTIARTIPDGITNVVSLERRVSSARSW